MAARRGARKASGSLSGGLRWLAAGGRRFTIRGLAWLEENGGNFSRLPLRAKGVVREPVWNLAQCPASARVAFRSDTTRLAVRAANPDAGLMMHMPATGSRGLALYCGGPQRMRPWGTAIPQQDDVSYETTFFTGLKKEVREFRLYLPLYKGLHSLAIGLDRGARILRPSPPTLPRPLVFYGTSITQGGCASTAGTDFVSAVGRMLNLDVVNLGFSGNGKGEPELAALIREIDAALYVLDYVANVTPARLRWTLPRFVRVLREKRPRTPILLVTNICYARYDYSPEVRRVIEAKRDIMMDYYVRARKRGDRDLHLADGFGLVRLGDDGATVDGVHLTDHGFRLMADGLAPIIERIILRNG